MTVSGDSKEVNAPETQSGDNPEKTPVATIDGYLTKFNEDLIWRFERDLTFADYTLVRDYDFGTSNLKLFSKPRSDTTLKEFLVQGIVDVSKENLLALLTNLKNRPLWDSTYVEHEDITYIEETCTDVTFSVSKYPFPLTKRTYMVTRTLYNTENGTVALLSLATDKYKTDKKYRWSTHVDDFESLLILKDCKDDENQARTSMVATYFENPKAMVPNAYVNLITGQVVPGILAKMVIASQKLDHKESVGYCGKLKYSTLKFEDKGLEHDEL
ncbi:lipid-binding/transfer protein, putative [Theileria equi strain WA]|uniref:Lipid-binding/transfer protein, putative n=1 Tax=Theileria equi strain WA TaxID=1537102 RepID=L0AZQ5_THEEQ|nr:lipid-binding/transfer protein, putative [Theileria equi strain WA]AFZ81082.1 lipid-binding/transfer protein, putative [Theileria equi strain WA]|eukprot:XP_004830748.1 lipid-binding/transfer protein, putative [Theileria equi strain WA]